MLFFGILLNFLEVLRPIHTKFILDSHSKLIFKFFILASQVLISGVQDRNPLVQILVLESEEIYIDPHIFLLFQKLNFGFKLFSQKGVLFHYLNHLLVNLLAFLPQLIHLAFEQVDCLLVAHQHRLHVVQLLKVCLGVYDIDFAYLSKLGRRDSAFIIEGGQLLRHLFV